MSNEWVSTTVTRDCRCRKFRNGRQRGSFSPSVIVGVGAERNDEIRQAAAEKPDTECLTIGSWPLLGRLEDNQQTSAKGALPGRTHCSSVVRSGYSSFVAMMQSAGHGNRYNPA